ncbi:DUF4405 domain-containing protein [Methanofollis formosanus]|uniref:DUF4405 domain-containing protein n=1 Tax=Methanofollis formosanus TaxID=299308 RepID=A0A8G1A3F8_9EURY|nr:DUF4405 domain-containing protein [Methanofollis formosanus]QYZ79377.1 DUF4405 domain-containing protein [Methanofollis formosanus]
MQKRQINAVIDLALLVAFIIVGLTSVVLFFFLPSGGGGFGWVHAGTGATNLRVFLGVTRGQWVDLHNITGLIFMVLMIVHIVLHIPFYRTIRRCLSGSGNEKCDRE